MKSAPPPSCVPTPLSPGLHVNPVQNHADPISPSRRLTGRLRLPAYDGDRSSGNGEWTGREIPQSPNANHLPHPWAAGEGKAGGEARGEARGEKHPHDHNANNNHKHNNNNPINDTANTIGNNTANTIGTNTANTIGTNTANTIGTNTANTIGTNNNTKFYNTPNLAGSFAPVTSAPDNCSFSSTGSDVTIPATTTTINSLYFPPKLFHAELLQITTGDGQSQVTAADLADGRGDIPARAEVNNAETHTQLPARTASSASAATIDSTDTDMGPPLVGSAKASESMYVCVCVCMYVCMYACMYLYMYVCL
jgi:hypothetical protein